MNKTFLVLFSSFLLFLTACNTNETEEANQTDSTEESEENTNSEEAADNGELTAESLITAAEENASGKVSYSADQKVNLTQGEETETYQNVLTIGEQDEMKSAVNNNGAVETHYIYQGDHYVYQNQSLEQVDGEENLEGNSYEEIVAKLKSYPEGELSNLEDGYAITIDITEPGSLENVFDSEADFLQQVEAVDGTLQLYFNADQVFTGSEFEGSLTIDGESADVSGTVDYSRIGDVDVIEKPSNMTEE